MGATELVVGASSSRVEVVERSTTEGEDIVVYTTEGIPIEAQIPEARAVCLLIFGAMCLRFASHTTLSLFSYALGTIACFFVGEG